MGSYVSCASASAGVAHVTRVVGFDGEVEEFKQPVKAAEVMLENPHHFLCHAGALRAGRRIPALPADEELQLGQVYFLLPMHRLRNVLSDSDVASLEAAKRGKSLPRVLPSCGVVFCRPIPQLIRPGLGLFGPVEEKRSEKFKAPEDDMAVHRLRAEDFRERRCGSFGGFRYWKPILETITEVPTVESRHKLLA